MRSGPTHNSSRGRVRSRSLTGIAAAAAVVMTLPAVACAQTGSLGGGSTGSTDISLIPPNILHPPVVGIGAGDGVTVVESPAVTTATVMDSLNIPWDVVRTPDGTILTGERGGRMVAKLAGGQQREVAIPLPGLVRQSESGLMGMAVDAGFAQNRELHVCWSHDAGGQRDNRITTFRAADDWSGMTKVRDTLTGIPLGDQGIHSGCRLLTDPDDGSIYVGTGDAFTATGPQSRASLAGKTLHIRPDGTPASGPSVIHTIGHRNLQGLAINDSGAVYSAEHGPDVDDEVNLLQQGANYGWNPDAGGQYNQNVPMTDTGEFPGAVKAVWSSGKPTLASADIEFLKGSAWGEWEGALAMANLKTQKLVLLRLADDGKSVRDAAVLLEGDFGRLRSLTSEPDGSLLVTTSDADRKDSVFRVSPTATPAP